MHGDVRDVRLADIAPGAAAGDEHQPAVAEDGPAAPGDEVVAPVVAGLAQLVVEHVGAPRTRVGIALDGHDLADVPRPHRLDDERPADGAIEHPLEDAHDDRSVGPAAARVAQLISASGGRR